MTLLILASPILLLQILITLCEKIDDPTLKPANPFSASADAAIIYEESESYFLAANGKKVDKTWFHKTYEQRVEITNYYREKYGEPIEWGLQYLADDNLDDLYTDSFLSSQRLLGTTVHEVIIGKWKEVGAIEEIVCCNDKDIKDRIADDYKNAFPDTPSIENHMATFRKDDREYQHVLQQYCWKGLCQEKRIKPEDADKEAKALREIDPKNDGEKFKQKLNELLDKNCEPDMKLIFEKYRQGKDGIVGAVEKAFKVERVERAYNRLVRCIEDSCRLYADQLKEAVDCGGTDTDRINRIVVSRCERDLGSSISYAPPI